MSQAGGNSSGGGGGGSGIMTINGDSGSVTGSTVTLFANVASNNSGATVNFTNSGTTSTFNVSDINNNTFLGTNSGSSNISNVYTSTALGFNTLSHSTSGALNVAVGNVALYNNISGVSNVAVGVGAGGYNFGSYNTLIGQDVMNHYPNLEHTTGSYCTLIGYKSGSTYTSSENSNILINNIGVNGESNAIHIGTSGSGSNQQNKCFIAGIAGVSGSGNTVLVNPSTGQLYDSGGSGGGVSGPVSSTNRAISTWNGTSGSALFDNTTATLDSSGRYRNTGQIVFNSTLSANDTNVTGDGTIFTIGTGNPLTVTQQGSSMSTTGTFTAPVDGYYLFSMNISVSGTTLATDGIGLIIANGSQYTLDRHLPTNLNSDSYNGTIVVPLLATQIVIFQIYVAGTTKTVSTIGGAGNQTTLHGFMIC